jgi:dinuclear metal center YbgI/SA1388 family protein
LSLRQKQQGLKYTKRKTKQPLKRTAVYELINNDIATMCAHTSYDKATGGINDNLAKLLDLKNTKKLENGYVVVGELEREMSIDDFAVLVGETLDTHGLRYTDTDKMIKTVAVGGGACGEFINDAMQNADCFVTSDLKYHEMLDASESGFAVINAGHFETENVPFLMLKEKLEKEFEEVEFIVAPFHLSSVSGKRWPISPIAAAPKIASEIA